MDAPGQKQAHVELKPRANHGVNFPERYLKVTIDGVVRQGQPASILVSDAGHHPFALLVAVDALVSKFGQATLDEQGITVPESFFRKRKDDSGWHRDAVLTALAALDRRLDGARVSAPVPAQVTCRGRTSTVEEAFDAASEQRRARVTLPSAG